MNYFTKLVMVFSLILLKPIISHSIENDSIIKVGVVQEKPYYYVEDGIEKGYYAEFFQMLNENSAYKYDLVYTPTEDVYESLLNDEIDTIVGYKMTSSRLKEYEYSKHPIVKSKYGLYTKDGIEYGNLQELEGKNIARLNHSQIEQQFEEYLKSKGINVNYTTTNCKSERDQLLANNYVDAVVKDTNSSGDLNLLYRLESEELYMVSLKEDKNIILEYDKLIENTFNFSYNFSNYDKVHRLYKSYFYANYIDRNEVVLLCIFVVLSYILYAVIKSNKVETLRIKRNIDKDLYVVHYQPIINLENKKIRGLEALIRYNKNGELLYPNKFIDKIEKNNMSTELSLYVLKKIIDDYNKLSKLYGDFYISLNITINDIESDKFINEASNILKKSNIGKGKICLEIIERVKSKDCKKVNKSILKLRDVGFIIAIDDFGVDYANINLLYKIKFDILKLDRFFINDIDISKDNFKQDMISVFYHITQREGVSLVIEGVERIEQENIINRITNNNVCAQGYLYKKPCDIDELLNMNKYL